MRLVAPTPCRVDVRLSLREEAGGRDWDTLGRQLGLGAKGGKVASREKVTNDLTDVRTPHGSTSWRIDHPVKCGGLHVSFLTELSKVNRLNQKELVLSPSWVTLEKLLKLCVFLVKWETMLSAPPLEE